jgi:BirA family biotin operon repressor/biotin-[acetyl-CoA-carboxylase] ligase
MKTSIDSRILRVLRDAGDGTISAAEVAQQVGVGRSAIAGRVQALRSLGYEIETTPHLGYRLLDSPDLLHADDLTSRMEKGTVIGREIHVFEETTSTNDVIEKFARDGVKEGVVVFAEAQTGGRGRLGRKWISPRRKGLWFSILLRPDLRPDETTQLTVASATALRRAIEKQTGLNAQIKWPNDILIAGRKTAGILTELRAEVDRVDYIILGIGVDVNLNANDLPADLRKLATSLKAELGKPVSRPELAARILRELEADYARIMHGQFSRVSDEWEEHCDTIGRRVSIRIGERLLRGRAESLSEEGALLLRTDHGHLERVIGGDVSLEK